MNESGARRYTRREDSQMSMRGVSAFFVVVPLVLLVDGTARADGPGTVVGRRLRPAIHIDRYGRTLVDVCPERTPGGRRCFAHRIVRPGSTRPIVESGGDVCTSSGGGGGSSPPSGAMTPTDVLTRYDIPATAHANGAIVALVELPSTHGLTDVNAYRAKYGIAALAECPVDSSGVPTPGGTACFARVGSDGTTKTVSSTDCPGWAGETGLDMDMVSAACPDCSIVLAEAASDETLDGMNKIAATVVHAAAVSNSWGAPELPPDDETPYESTGILTVAASGDDGYLDEEEGADAPNFPASSPYVLAVGGTTMKGPSPFSEIVWNDSSGSGGSGCSTEFAMPSWQSSSGFSFGTCKMRASVDVSAAAEFDPGGIASYDQDDGGWNSVVGTSAASPLVAAIMVRLGLAGTDNHALLYSHISAFNDITSGDDYSACGGSVMCTAAKGWDGPTGLGTPNGTALLALGGMTSPTPDAGSTTTADGGTTSTVDGGAHSAADGGTVTPGGSDAGASGPPGGIGSPCSAPSQCNGDNQCVSPTPGGSSICTQACESTSACPANYECQGGFCIPAPAGTSDTPSGVGGFGGSGAQAGCACSAAPASSPWTGTGWLTLGLLALVRRSQFAKWVRRS
jgi:MYXO-CTERM domain-containing protein